MPPADSPVALTLWRYIERSLDRLVAVAVELSEQEQSTPPPVEDANSIATLVGHTLGNAEENLLGTLGGFPVAYDRAADFEAPVTDAAAIEARWANLRTRVEALVMTLDDASVLAARVHPRRGEITGLEVLIIVARHASEHLAHAELTRDWLRSAASSAN